VNTEVTAEPEVGDDEPARFPVRRVVRWVTILTVGILAVLAIWQEPLYAGWH
jgi:hypothetical protein